MSREIKSGKAMTFRLQQELCDKIDSYSRETMLSKTAIVEKALITFFEKEYENSVKNNTK